MTGQLVLPGQATDRRSPDVVTTRGDWLALSQAERDSYLPPSARELVVKGIPPNTIKAYGIAWRHFRVWCEEVQRTPAPASQDTMIHYLDHLRRFPVHVKCSGGVQSNGEPCRGHRPSPSAIKIWHAAVKFYHGVGEPPLPWEGGKRLELAIGGYFGEMDDLGWRPARAPRAYESDVTRMVDSCDLSTGKGLRDRAVILNNFYGATRASDLARFRIADVKPFPLGIDMELRRQKTTKMRQIGKKVGYRTIHENLAHPQYCGVEAIMAWTGWLRGQGVTTGALYRPFSKPHTKTVGVEAPVTSPGVLLRGKRDAIDYMMDSTSLSEVIQDAAIRASLPNAEDYTCHSLRRGRATQQRQLGVDPLDIARAYDWAPGGAINEYLEEADRQSPTAPGAVGML